MTDHSDRPIFVVGCARSGTTLLQVMLQSHPRLAMPPENRFVMPVYRNRVEFGDLRDPVNVDAVADFIVGRKQSKFGDLGVGRSAARTRMHEVPPTIGSLLGGVLELYAQRFGKQRWGDKRPNYIQDLDVVLALFPDAQIIHIIRDGRDCVASLKQMPWWTFGYPASVYKWARAIDTAMWARGALRPDQYHEVHYEDLVSDPRPHLADLCRFLDEDFDEAMLQPHRVADVAVPERKGWHTRVRQPVSQTAVHRWQDDLEPDEVRLFEHVAGRQLEAVGYERSLGFGQRRPSRQARAAYRAFLRQRRRKEQAEADAERVAKADYPFPVAAALTSEQRRLAASNGVSELLGQPAAASVRADRDADAAH